MIAAKTKPRVRHGKHKAGAAKTEVQEVVNAIRELLGPEPLYVRDNTKRQNHAAS